MKFSVRDWAVLIFTVTVSLALLMLVGVGAYAIVANTIDWTTNHIKGPNITTPLATLLGSLLSAVIAGVVGFIGGSRSAKKPSEPETPLPPDTSSVDPTGPRMPPPDDGA